MLGGRRCRDLVPVRATPLLVRRRSGMLVLRSAVVSSIAARGSQGATGDTPSPGSDADLVVAVAGGDRDALAELYDRYAGVLLGLGIKVLRNRREAEDLVHDVFLEVWRRAHSYD